MKSFYKIIHTSGRILWGNRERRILNESLWMKENGHQVAIVTPGASPLFEKAKQNGLMVYPMSFKSLARIGEYSRLKQIFTGEHPFVVNAHGRGDAKLALKAAQTADVPCLIMSRHNGERVKSTWPNKKIYKTRCHYIFTTSTDSRTHLKQTFSLSDMQIFSIPDGIAMADAAVCPDKTHKKTARQKIAKTIGLEPDACFIAIFGNIMPNKIELLNKTANQLSQKFPHHHLILPAFSENQAQELRAMIEKSDAGVHILPMPQKKDASLYQALDCCVYLPNPRNFYQGVPQDVTRAMAYLCPVIAPDASGVRDILIENETGRIFDPDQPETLTKTIGWILDHSRETLNLTQTARALVDKHYTMDAMGRDLLRIYRLHQVKIDRQYQIPAMD